MIPDTFIFGILVALLMLGPLIILHEFGHFFAAKLSKVKVLEFGFGFPPKMFGIWTGATDYFIARKSEFEPDQFNKGDMVAVHYIENDEHERYIILMESIDNHKSAPTVLTVTGKIREIYPDRVVLKDMLWSINWLPFGGFVRLLGEENPDAHDSLAGKSPLTRLGVLVAGVAVNAILPFIIFTIAVIIPVSQNVGDVVVTSVFPDSPAYEAGIRPFHKIHEVDGSEIKSYADLQSAVTRKLGSESTWVVQRGIPNLFPRPDEPQYQYLPDERDTITLIPRWDPPRYKVVMDVTDQNTQMRLGVARVYNPSVGINNQLNVVQDGTVDDTLNQVHLTIAQNFMPDAQIGDTLPITNFLDGTGIPYILARQIDQRLGSTTYIQEGAAGIQLRLDNQRIEARGVPWTSAISAGFNRTIEIITLARNSIFGALSGSRNPQFEGPIAVGPVGLSQLSGEVATADIPISARALIILTLAATLSISLAVINLLPIPGLDGGRMAFVIIELIRGGKRISPEKENLVHLSGFVILILLLIVVSFNDVSRIFSGEGFF